jgi:sporulation protein YabP
MTENRIDNRQDNRTGKHTLTLEFTLERKGRLSMTGVLEVLSFDEEMITADTNCGVVVVKGEGLHIDNLNLEKGDLSLTGEVNGVNYEDSYGVRGSFLGRLFK